MLDFLKRVMPLPFLLYLVVCSLALHALVFAYEWDLHLGHFFVYGIVVSVIYIEIQAKLEGERINWFMGFWELGCDIGRYIARWFK